MIVSKSQSQATLPEERSRRLTFARLAIASFIIHYFGSQARSRFGGHCPRWGRFAQADCRHEMRPMTFLDPGAFIVTDVVKRRTSHNGTSGSQLSATAPD
jgi:hypothetical protein